MFSQIQGLRSGSRMQFMPAVESEGLRNGELLRLTGPAIPLDKISANGRKYIAESVHMQVADLQPRIKKKALFGCLDHPPTTDLAELAYVKMTEVSHRIDAMWYDEATKTYMITVTILDTPNGRILKAIHDAGSPLYVSLRSLLDPARNVQRNGYVDAWILALITIDFVSRPGFADAELQAVDVSNECALAVCESLNLFTQHKRNFDMKTSKTKAQYIPLIALEGITGIATEPTKEFKGVVDEFIADVLNKFPGKFTTSDFATAYPDSLFNGHVVCLYEDTNELMIQDDNMRIVAMIPMTSEVDGEFMLADDAEVEYLDTQINPNSDPAQRSNEMYPVISTEDYTPDEAFMETANNIAEFMRQNYHNGFTQDEFNTDIASQLQEQFQVDARIDTTEDQEPELKFVGNGGTDGASILLTVNEDGSMVPGQLSEYWMPGTESIEVGQNVKLIDGNGELIVEGEAEVVGTFGECKDTIKDEDETGFNLMVNAELPDDTEVVKIDGNWYYIEDGMSVECDEPAPAEPGTESYPVKLKSPVCVNGTVIPAGESLQFNAQGMADFNGQAISIYDFPTAAIETIEVEPATVGNQNPALPIDQNYMQQSGTGEGEGMQAQIVEDEDDNIIAEKQHLAEQMYQIVEDGEATIVEDDDDKDPDPDDDDKDKGSKKDDDDDPSHDDHNYNELAEEAQRIFNMPSSKFAGNYAIEHMPAAYKHLWAGMSDAGKAVLAKQATAQNIATEAACLQFWANTNFIAVERAVLINKGKVEAALENLTLPDPKVSFLKGGKA